MHVTGLVTDSPTKRQGVADAIVKYISKPSSTEPKSSETCQDCLTKCGELYNSCEPCCQSGCPICPACAKSVDKIYAECKV